MFNILILQIIFQNILIFHVVINMNDLNILYEFCLCEIFEYFKDFENNTYLFVWYKKVMYESNCVINEHDEIPIFFEWNNLHWFIYIKVNQYSLFRMLIVNRRKIWSMYLSHYASNAYIHLASYFRFSRIFNFSTFSLAMSIIMIELAAWSYLSYHMHNFASRFSVTMWTAALY